MAANHSMFFQGDNYCYATTSLPYRTYTYKRVVDILLTILLLPLALPFVVVAVLLTMVSSRGPVFFIQQRVGLGGRVFNMYKIRTMVYNPNGPFYFTIPNDERITAVGNFLRKFKLDELPQLWNVLNGDMSLVGPRPERVEIVQYFSAIDKKYAYRHTIKPGMTGLAQVNCPLATPNENLVKLNFDLYYISNFSVLLEIKILLKTIEVILKMKSL